MAGAAVLGRLTWLAAEVIGTIAETPRVRTLRLRADGWPGHRAGQHLDVRLTAEDGYQAQRSYSIASAPGDGLEITVERLEDGEVSPYLVDEVREGDRFEVRGPIGGYFVWDGSDPAPLLLVGGGSGVVPLAAMIRHRAAAGSVGVDVEPRDLLDRAARAAHARRDGQLDAEELQQQAADRVAVEPTVTRVHQLPVAPNRSVLIRCGS